MFWGGKSKLIILMATSMHSPSYMYFSIINDDIILSKSVHDNSFIPQRRNRRRNTLQQQHQQKVGANEL